MYELIFFNKAKKQLKKLPKENQERIINALGRIRVRPFQHHSIKRLVDSHYYRMRIGKYRIILDIIKNKLIIFVIELAHRKNIYK